MAGDPIARDKLDAFGIDALCAAVSDGDSLSVIARRVGVSKGSLLNWLSADVDRSARAFEARRDTAWHWDEMAEEEIRIAEGTSEGIAKARELASHFRWRAAIINPAYRPAQKQEISGPNGGPVQVEDTREPLGAILARAKAKAMGIGE